MTLDRLIKDLQKLQAAGHGRAAVGVDKDSLYDGNGSWVICRVESAEFKFIHKADDDGGIAYTKTGSEITMRMIVLRG